MKSKLRHRSSATYSRAHIKSVVDAETELMMPWLQVLYAGAALQDVLLLIYLLYINNIHKTGYIVEVSILL